MTESKRFDHGAIDAKWQERWVKERTYAAHHPAAGQDKRYVLDMFPYPSGAGLHVGHPEGYIASDILARYYRAKGYAVLHPMGWDAFGLPAENYALQTGTHPRITTEKNINRFREQLQRIGLSYDWDREVNTTDPAYYKWTQWIFLQLFKAGLAYEAEAPINWCPKDRVGLANEEVIDGRCERCGTRVERRMLKQWFLRITKYAERLLEGLEKLDWPEHIKTLQRNWIGKSSGAEVTFTAEGGDAIPVFTTRPDTLFGATYLVLAPEHPLVAELTKPKQKKTVEKYVKDAAKKSELERTALEKEKTGVSTGAFAENPVNSERIPIWVADYVMGSYGTGAIMAVPAHDERDFAFATKFELPIREVVVQRFGERRKDAIRRDSAAAVIVRDGKVLVLYNTRYHTYVVVSGGYEEGESPEQTITREIQEETGFTDIKIKKYLGAIEENFYVVEKSVWRHKFHKGYLVELRSERKGKTARESYEQYEIQWLSPVEAVKKLSLDKSGQEEFVRRALNVKGNSFTGEGTLANSGQFDGILSTDARKKIVAWLEKDGKAKATLQYKLRDWVFSRQRYWGEPIPIVHCPEHGAVPVPEKELPLKLPEVEKYEPTGTGESPLSAITEWVNTKCPECGKPAKRETNTMPQWAGSSWYFYRFTDPKNSKAFASTKALETWIPVDFYIGGAEHAVLHLLYARFWHKVLCDLGHIPKEVGDEPFLKLRNQGLILGEDGEKMSKSRGNVVTPDEILDEYGADAFRCFEMFMGPLDMVKPWSTRGIVGLRRFLDRVWRIGNKPQAKEPPPHRTLVLYHQTVQKVTEDIESQHYNTAISALMVLANAFDELPERPREEFERFLLLLEPFAPHLARELLDNLGINKSSGWPVADVSFLNAEITVVYAVQVSGKLRGSVIVPKDAPQERVVAAARKEPNVARFIAGEPKKVIFIPGKLVNFVV